LRENTNKQKTQKTTMKTEYNMIEMKKHGGILTWAIVVITFLVAFFLTGCVGINSGNVGGGIKPLPYEKGEHAVITETTQHTDADGKVTTTVITKKKTGLAVNEGIQHGRLDMATKVGVAQANGTTSPSGCPAVGTTTAPHTVGAGPKPPPMGRAGGTTSTASAGRPESYPTEGESATPIS
jgi:hypothetical protein